MAWDNDDGLYIKFGLDEGVAANGGQILDSGPYRVLEFDLSYTDFDHASGTIVNDVVKVPDGARIDYCEVVAHTLVNSAGNGMTLDIGLAKASDRTELDYNGLVAALPEASMDPAGDYQTINIAHSQKGALIGTTLTQTGLLTTNYGTEVPTAGRIKFRIYFYMTE